MLRRRQTQPGSRVHIEVALVAPAILLPPITSRSHDAARLERIVVAAAAAAPMYSAAAAAAAAAQQGPHGLFCCLLQHGWFHRLLVRST